MEEAEIAAEVARSFVKVPNDPLKASKPCPICKEKFKQQWNEASEDFVWKDAKQVDGVVSVSLVTFWRRAANADCCCSRSIMLHVISRQDVPGTTRRKPRQRAL